MNAETLGAIVGAALGAGGLGAILAYVTTRRRTSGEVRTTDADRLWTQNDKLIEAYAKDNHLLRERVALAESRLYEKLNLVEVKVDGVHADVRTGNALSMGEMMSDEETRRIQRKAQHGVQLTDQDRQHLVDVPPKNGGDL